MPRVDLAKRGAQRPTKSWPTLSGDHIDVHQKSCPSALRHPDSSEAATAGARLYLNAVQDSSQLGEPTFRGRICCPAFDMRTRARRGGIPRRPHRQHFRRRRERAVHRTGIAVFELFERAGDGHGKHHAILPFCFCQQIGVSRFFKRARCRSLRAVLSISGYETAPAIFHRHSEERRSRRPGGSEEIAGLKLQAPKELRIGAAAQIDSSARAVGLLLNNRFAALRVLSWQRGCHSSRTQRPGLPKRRLLHHRALRNGSRGHSISQLGSQHRRQSSLRSPALSSSKYGLFLPSMNHRSSFAFSRNQNIGEVHSTLAPMYAAPMLRCVISRNAAVRASIVKRLPGSEGLDDNGDGLATSICSDGRRDATTGLRVSRHRRLGVQPWITRGIAVWFSRNLLAKM